jgi:4-hydroxy-tetrahydrodipicolinate synthase
LPAAVSKATALAVSGDLPAARRAHLALLPVHESMFLESNPAPVKGALAQKGLMRDTVRGPLMAASKKTREAVAAAVATWEEGRG